MARDPHAATCDECEWSHTAYNRNEAQIISVLHVLYKHPERYLEITGNNPDIKKAEYQDYYVAYRKDI